jgi:hypothetical protein
VSRSSLFLGPLLLAACQGTIGQIPDDVPPPAGSPPASGAGAPATPGVMPAAPPPPSRPRAPLRRLSRQQYNNTVRDLLGDSSRPADQFVLDEQPGAFAGTEALAQPSPALVEQYRAAAERLAATATANVDALLACPAQSSEAACVGAFIASFGGRAWRRPLGSDEAARYLALYQSVRTDGTLALGVKAVMTALLSSPNFLYRVELPPPGAAVGTVVPVNPYALAARLSYFLWDSMPDAALTAAAQSGRLASPVDVEAQARRLLKDPRSREVTADFFGHWLGLGGLDTIIRDPRLFPAWTDQLRRSMREETLRFAADVVFARDGKLETLLLSPRSMVDATLGSLYGVAGGGSFAAADLDPGQRAGLLTEASVLTLTANADSTSPTRRGKLVRDRLLCQPPPPPPPQAEFMLPRAQPGQTARQRFAQHVANPSCAACHTLTDPIGFGFESYDPIGRFRTVDNGQPVDASGEVTGTEDADGPFVGAVALARRLAGSQQVRACFGRQWFGLMQGRPDEPGDQASVAAALAAFAVAGGDLRELMVALTGTDAFRLQLVEGP